mgnify:CR=1 FL=1
MTSETVHKRHAWRYWPTVLATILVLGALFMPGPAVPDVGVPAAGVAVHFGLFALWSAAVAWDFPRRALWQVALAALALAAATELGQTLAVERSFSVFDIITDLAGALFALLLVALFRGRRGATAHWWGADQSHKQ